MSELNTCIAPERRTDRIFFDRWTERRQDEAAQLIASAYRGHIDSEINDQYRSAEGARRFLGFDALPRIWISDAELRPR